MKILCFFPVGDGESYSGGERQFIEISKIWKNMGNEIHLVANNKAKLLCEKFGLKAKFHIFNLARINLAGLEDFLTVKRMVDTIPKEKFDFIYCPGEPFPYVLASVMAKHRLRIPLVGSVNLLNPEDTSILTSIRQALVYSEARRGIKYFTTVHERLIFCFKKHVRNFLVKKMDIIFSVSHYIKDLLIKMGIEKRRIYPVHIGVNFSFIQAVAQKFKDDKKFDACFLGSIIPRKGVIDLIKAWKIVNRKKPNARVIIIGGGKGPYLGKVKELAKKMNLLKNIVFTGFVSEEEKYKLLAQSRVFVFPSYLEGNPLVLCEAMACGLPVVVYDLPYYKENYGEKMIYVRKGDIKELATTILTILENTLIQERLSRESIELARHRSWEIIAKYELETIKILLRNKSQ
ncbi:MAG: glycosyltransferase family 4 protein [Candidatus Bathyarchaeia archaeon]